ncbi:MULTISPECIES: hypothetical protein [unclassified Burkholderia]|uniref:hypothetical protein n=1 Tax=unclassified Burkholderia TaxID=2613784 RepID=UPI002AAF22ED|nr:MULTISPECIES: hypothetical protein [unclassified Burkholderia]
MKVKSFSVTPAKRRLRLPVRAVYSKRQPDAASSEFVAATRLDQNHSRMTQKMKSFTSVVNLATMQTSAQSQGFGGWFRWIGVCLSGEAGANGEKNGLDNVIDY